mgnify:CR=1 FL=1
MRVYRLTREKYSTDLNGRGAAKFANRWNSKGTELIYTSESRALAMSEVAVHLSLALLPNDYVMLVIDIPEEVSIKTMDMKSVPKDWNTHPPSIWTQRIGDEFIDANKFCILKVPSAVVPGDHNLLINPHHKDFKKISIVEVKGFQFDKRLFK